MGQECGRAGRVPIPCFESVAGPLEQVALHRDAVVCVHIVLQLGVVIREVLLARERGRQREGTGSQKDQRDFDMDVCPLDRRHHGNDFTGETTQNKCRFVTGLELVGGKARDDTLVNPRSDDCFVLFKRDSAILIQPTTTRLDAGTVHLGCTAGFLRVGGMMRA